MELPREFYYIIGVFVVSQLGAVLTIIKALFERHTEIALMKAQAHNHGIILSEIKAELAEMRSILLKRS